MFNSLKNHPFEVEAYFEYSLVLTFAVPKQELEHYLPPSLSLDSYEDTWAFLALAMVKTSALRPLGFPKFLGNDFFLIGYRIFVNYIDRNGKKKRGLYILKSQTDRKKMEYLGSIFTQYNYETVDIQTIEQDNRLTVSSQKANFLVEIDTQNTELPVTSPFQTWKEAKYFSGPLPLTFSYLQKSNDMLIVKGLRQNWKPQAVSVVRLQESFISSLTPSAPLLANAFIIKNIPYQWEKGKIESLTS